MHEINSHGPRSTMVIFVSADRDPSSGIKLVAKNCLLSQPTQLRLCFHQHHQSRVDDATNVLITVTTALWNEPVVSLLLLVVVSPYLPVFWGYVWFLLKNQIGFRDNRKTTASKRFILIKTHFFAFNYFQKTHTSRWIDHNRTVYSFCALLVNKCYFYTSSPTQAHPHGIYKLHVSVFLGKRGG